MPKIKLNLRGLTIPEKIARTQQIVAALTGNTNFPTPHPTLAEVMAAVNELETAANAAHAARLEARRLTRAQKLKEDELYRVMMQLASHVSSVAGDDESLILSAGFDTRAPNTPASVPEAPEPLSAEDGTSPGEMRLLWPPVRGARSYVVERSTDAQNNSTTWMHAAVSPRAGVFINGLETGARYWFRVAAVNAAGQGPWCNSTSKIAP